MLKILHLTRLKTTSGLRTLKKIEPKQEKSPTPTKKNGDKVSFLPLLVKKISQKITPTHLQPKSQSKDTHLKQKSKHQHNHSEKTPRFLLLFRTVFKFISPLVFLGIFIYVIFTTPPPQTLAQATPLQYLKFFTPLYLFFISLVFVFLGSILNSLIIGAGLSLLILLKGLGDINTITICATAIIVLVLLKMFKNRKEYREKHPFKKLEV